MFEAFLTMSLNKPIFDSVFNNSKNVFNDFWSKFSDEKKAD